MIERLKARLWSVVLQIFGINYSLTFIAVINMSRAQLILVLARKWGVSAKRGNIPSVYAKADKEDDHDIYMQIPQGMFVSDDMRRDRGVRKDDVLVLKLNKALYRLKQVGRLWSKLLHGEQKDIGFVHSLTDIEISS